jgi:small subunit ribosomal protein S1
VVTFGAFVEILDGVEGLVHISELAQHHVDNPREIIQPGDPVRVKILEIDSERRRLSLSIKRVEGQVLPVRPIQPPVEGDGSDLDDVPELGLSEDVFSGAEADQFSGDQTEEFSAGETEQLSSSETEQLSAGETEELSSIGTEQLSVRETEEPSAGETEELSGSETEEVSGSETEEVSVGETEDTEASTGNGAEADSVEQPDTPPA